MSGSETISISGTPERLRSMCETPSSPSCSDLPASSSMWMRVMPMRFSPPSFVGMSRYPCSTMGTANWLIW